MPQTPLLETINDAMTIENEANTISTNIVFAVASAMTAFLLD